MSTKDFYQVIVSDQATKMLISHSVFLSQVDPAAAEHLIIEFEKTSHSLEFMPQRCSWFKADIFRRINIDLLFLKRSI